MYRPKLFAILTITFMLGQSIHSGYGLGERSFTHSASALSMSSRGIIPSFTENVSLSNPVTWNHLKFAYLAGNISGNEVSSNLGTNGHTDFNSLQFAVSIGSNYAWGFGVRPLFSHKLSLIGSSSDEFIVNGDTLNTQHFVDGSGGVSSLYTAIRFPITANEGAAIELDILFGSYRKDTKLRINDRDYHYYQRHIYDGSLYRLFLTSNRFNKGQIPANIYLMISGAIKSLRANHLSFQPFEDVNKNGYFDTSPPSDSPNPSSVPNAESSIFKNIYNPFEFGAGLDFKLKNNKSHIMAEFYHWKDNGNKSDELFSLKSLYIDQSNQYSISFAKFSSDDAFKLSQKIQYRSGVYFRHDNLYNNTSSVNEFGLTAGFGIKFGRAKNQLDFAYKYGLRSGDVKSDEIIQQITFGVQIGDLWFVKRRPK